MKINKIKFAVYLILLVCLVNLSFAQQPTLLSLQGKLTNSTSGAKIISADLRVNINDSSGNIAFNQNYSDGVSNGIFDLVLGSTYSLNLSFNEQYNLTVFVNNETRVGGPFPFRGGQGQIGAGDIATTESYIFSNVSVIGNVSVGGNLSVDTNVFFVDSLNDMVGIGTTSPVRKLDVSGDVAIYGSLNATYINATSGNFTGTVEAGSITSATLRTSNIYESDGSTAWLSVSSCGADTGVSSINADGTITCTADSAHTTDTTTDTDLLGIVNVSMLDNGSVLRIGNLSDISLYINETINISWYNKSIDLGDYYLKSENVSLWNKSGNNIFTADFGGNVGIGNTIPNSTLTVTGEVNMTQNVTIFGMKIWNNGTYWCFNQC